MVQLLNRLLRFLSLIQCPLLNFLYLRLHHLFVLLRDTFREIEVPYFIWLFQSLMPDLQLLPESVQLFVISKLEALHELLPLLVSPSPAK
jgi:hypothetical protein